MIEGMSTCASLRSTVACALLLLVPAQGWALCCALGHAGGSATHGVGTHLAMPDSTVPGAGIARPAIDTSREAACVVASASSVVLAERAPKLTTRCTPDATAILAVRTASPTSRVALPRDPSPGSAGETHRFSPLRI